MTWNKKKSLLKMTTLCLTLCSVYPVWAENITYPGQITDNPNGVANGPNSPDSVFPATDSSNNTVTYNSGVIVGGVYGGLGRPSGVNANANTVNVSGGTIGANVTGGWSFDANAFNNQIYIDNAEVGGLVFGGWAESSSINGSANLNTVQISGSSIIKNNIYGGYNQGNGGAVGNRVIILAGTMQASVDIIAGGFANFGGAPVYDNSVTINGGTIASADIYGGRGQGSTNVTTNSVKINGGIINSGSIQGGNSIRGGGLVNNNQVTINGGTIHVEVMGGHVSNGTGAVENNQVLISDGVLTEAVYGGQAVNGHASSNLVYIAGGNVTGDAYGGYTTGTGDSTNNSIKLSDGALNGNVYGGYTVLSGNATINSVNLSGGTLTGNAYGGYSSSGVVTDNTVSLSRNAQVNGDAYAGFSTAGTVTNNTVSLSGGTVTGTVYGSNLGTWQSDGNKLISVGGLTSVGGIKNFQFSTINSGATVNVTGNGTGAATFWDMSNNGTLSFYNQSADLNVGLFQGAYIGGGVIGLDALLGVNATATGADTIEFSNIPAGQVMLTFKPLAGSVPGVNTIPIKFATITGATSDTAFITVEHGYGIYAYKIIRVNDDYFLYTTDDHTGELGKPHSESAAAGLQQISQSTDILLFTGIDASVSESRRKGLGVYANIGYGSQKTDTGSSAKVKGTSAVLALAYETRSPVSVGVFGEFFKGKTKTENDATTSMGTFNLRADGDLKSYAVGIFAQYRPNKTGEDYRPWNAGPHIKTSARIGRSQLDFHSGLTDYKRKSTYYGASFGGGYVFELSEGVSMDVYSHGIWTHQKGNMLKDNLGQIIQFKNSNSFRILVGSRTYFALSSEQIRPFAGLGMDWEIDGKPKVFVDGYQAHVAKLSGLSGMAEIGLSVYPNTKRPLSLEFGLQGFLGKRDGFAGELKAKYWF